LNSITRFWENLNVTIAGESSEMSNKIALVSLDFGSTGSMCGDNKGVTANGPAIS